MKQIEIQIWDGSLIDRVAELLKSSWELHAKKTALYDLKKIANRDTIHWLETRVLKEKKFTIITAKESDKLAGVLMFSIAEGHTIAMYEKEFFIEDIVTHPGYYQTGVATQLLSFAEDMARNMNLNCMSGHIYRFNDASKNLFRKAGYESEYEAFYKLLDADQTKHDATESEQAKHMKEVNLYADGGSRGNPGPSAGGFAILDMENNVVIKSGKYLGITTNNQAEYHSLKGGLEAALKLQARKVHVYMDSLLVINQMKGVYKIRNRDLWPIHQAIKELVPKFESVNFTHVPREMNKIADSIVNETLDAEKA